jgi:hypothetical protein
MEQFPIRKAASGIHIDGIPDAVKAIELSGPQSRRLAHLALHQGDLQFVIACLEEINRTESQIARDALWDYAIVRFVKCFVGGSARSQLDERHIYKNEPQGMQAFDYFKNLRNKHVIHDENAYSQCIPSAAINAGNKPYKVEKILAMPVIGITLEQANYNNLHLLASYALTWVTNKFDELCNTITAELEKESHEALIARKSASFTIPNTENIGTRRATY